MTAPHAATPIAEPGTGYPRVSIGIPTYNSHGRILSTLRSIWVQQYPNLEVIISDNCSTDDTHELCVRQQKKYPVIRYFRQSRNIGVVSNFEFVMKQVTGTYFMWVADDDTLEPGILKKYVDFLAAHPDYSLVSGRILHWSGGRTLICEKGFNMEQNSAAIRVMQYYFNVMYGALYYGLMQHKTAEKIPLRNRIGDDWHFVATLAYLGKVKHLDCVGYNKKLGGLSKDFRQYARIIGATRFSAAFPHIRIALDAFSEIFYLSPVYTAMPGYRRLLLALSSCACLLIKHYCREFPFIVGGKIKRYLLKLYGLKQHNKEKYNRIPMT